MSTEEHPQPARSSDLEAGSAGPTAAARAPSGEQGSAAPSSGGGPGRGPGAEGFARGAPPPAGSADLARLRDLQRRVERLHFALERRRRHAAAVPRLGASARIVIVPARDDGARDGGAAARVDGDRDGGEGDRRGVPRESVEAPRTVRVEMSGVRRREAGRRWLQPQPVFYVVQGVAWVVITTVVVLERL